MLRKYFDIFQTVIYQYNKNVMLVYNTTNLIFKSRYPLAKNPTIEKVSETWVNQVFLRKILFNTGILISIKHVYRETCDNCDFTASSFDILNKNMLKYKAINIKFSNFIINNPENIFCFDKITFQHYNININIPRRKRISSLNNKIVNIPKRKRLSSKKNVDILEKKSITISTINNNDSSKNNPSNNNNNFDILELKSNTIPPINNIKSSKNDRSSINNNVDIPEQN